MRTICLSLTILLGLSGAWPAAACGSLVRSACADTPGEAPLEPRKLSFDVAPPAFATGDRFPVEERSLLMNPTRYRLPPVDGAWRYYAMDGVVYRVENRSALILEVIRDQRTWGLR